MTMSTNAVIRPDDLAVLSNSLLSYEVVLIDFIEVIFMFFFTLSHTIKEYRYSLNQVPFFMGQIVLEDEHSSKVRSIRKHKE